MDMRGLYCGLVCADILNLIDDNEELTRGMGDFIASCQTYEGGISYAPYGEAHGGYTYCGLAAAILIGEADKLDYERLADWLSKRQITHEGGFNGRINKLIDSCYNFWQGAAFELLDVAMKGKANINGEWLYRQEAMQAYTIYCCQETTRGGLKDKPTANPDPYHTMYSLAGCSSAQYKSDYDNLYADTEHAKVFTASFDGNYEKEEKHDNEEGKKTNAEKKKVTEVPEPEKTCLLGKVEKNRLRRMNVIHNARFDLVQKAKNYYRSLE